MLSLLRIDWLFGIDYGIPKDSHIGNPELEMEILPADNKVRFKTETKNGKYYLSCTNEHWEKWLIVNNMFRVDDELTDEQLEKVTFTVENWKGQTPPHYCYPKTTSKPITDNCYEPQCG